MNIERFAYYCWSQDLYLHFFYFFFFGRIQLYVLWIVLKGSIILKNRHFITQERFDKLIYGINTIMIYGIYTIIKCDIL